MHRSLALRAAAHDVHERGPAPGWDLLHREDGGGSGRGATDQPMGLVHEAGEHRLLGPGLLPRRELRPVLDHDLAEDHAAQLPHRRLGRRGQQPRQARHAGWRRERRPDERLGLSERARVAREKRAHRKLELWEEGKALGRKGGKR